MEPAGVQADHDRREDLQNPDPAEQLQVDRERPVRLEREAHAPTFISSDAGRANRVSSAAVALGLSSSLARPARCDAMKERASAPGGCWK